MRTSVVIAGLVLGLQSLAAPPEKKPAFDIPASAAPDKDVVDLAASSKDHTTLVTAVKAADYVTSLKNPGPFTVFAPTDAAFAKLPKGTLESLLKPENQGKLQKILQHHVTPATHLPTW